MVKKITGKTIAEHAISAINSKDIYQQSYFPTYENSIENIVQINKNFTIFGSKSFGSISQEWYEQHEVEQWSSLIVEESDIDLYKNLFAINSSIENMVTSLGGNFINTQELICKGQNYCQNYLEGDIISYGGGHLTPYGARILGFNLKQLLK